MNTLIIEAGSSKTDSVIISDMNTISSTIKGEGVNPVTDPNYKKALQTNLNHYQDREIDAIKYYGAGCINQEVNDQIKEVIGSTLGSNANIEIQDDLLAVGRGLCQQSRGIAVILGTGSNTGYYDGDNIVDGYKSGGYLLGDEGSGYRLGRELIIRYARNILSPSDAKIIESYAQVDAKDIIPHIYGSDNPRTQIASYASYLDHCSQGLKSKICEKVFSEFAEEVLSPLSGKYQCPVYISGSIAYHFKEDLLCLLYTSDAADE